MPNLYSTSAPPTWSVPRSLLQQTQPKPPPTLISYAFDPATGDIAVDGGGRVIYATPEQTATQAAAFIVSIQRAVYPIFSRSFGADIEGALMQRGTRSQTEMRVQNAMQEAIRIANDQRFRLLENFAFAWAYDTLTVTYTLVLANGAKYRQSRRLSLQ